MDADEVEESTWLSLVVESGVQDQSTVHGCSIVKQMQKVALLEDKGHHAVAAQLVNRARVVRYAPPELVLSGSSPLSARRPGTIVVNV